MKNITKRIGIGIGSLAAGWLASFLRQVDEAIAEIDAEDEIDEQVEEFSQLLDEDSCITEVLERWAS